MFNLTVGREELCRRIGAQVIVEDEPVRDEEVRQWRLEQIDRCVTAIDTEVPGVPVSNDGRTVDGVVDELLSRLNLAP